MIECELDFETVSLCDLKLCGAERYAEDLSTDVICLLFELHGIWYEWWPGCVGEADRILRAAAHNPEIYFVAHNAAFEQAIWRHKMVLFYGFDPIPISRWRCTLAACAWKGLRLALDRASGDLRIRVAKDKEGSKFTIDLSKRIKSSKKTRADGTAGYLPVLTLQVRRRVMDYCRQDVVVEDAIKQRVGLLNPAEQRVWELDQTINQRGIGIDREFVAASLDIVKQVSGPLKEEFTNLTGLAKVKSPKLLDWCMAHGLALDNLQKKTLQEALGTEDEDNEPDTGYISLAGDDYEPDVFQFGMSPLVRRVLEIRQMLGGAAIKKLDRMWACAGSDGRARGLLQYYAAHSGRWGGRLLQPQNFPRDSLHGIDPEYAVELIRRRDPELLQREFKLPALEVLARSLRHALVAAPGKVFVVGDYSSIEARVVLALAGQHDKTALLAGGYPVYFDMAEDIYNQPKGSWAVTEKELLKKMKEEHIAEYTIGKNTVLGCGFQMGPTKFHMRYCPDQPIEFAEGVVETYRKVWAPKVPELWYALDRAALRCVEHAEKREAYGVSFEPAGEWMLMRTPCPWSRSWYYDPRWHAYDERFGTYDHPMWTSMQSKQGKWQKINMYGGLLTENVVQHMARCLLVEAMFRVERAGMPVVLTCHDEIIIEVDEDRADEVSFRKLMIEPTKWGEAVGIPVDAEVWSGTRYKK